MRNKGISPPPQYKKYTFAILTQQAHDHCKIKFLQNPQFKRT
jgi:hypothetical protein